MNNIFKNLVFGIFIIGSTIVQFIPWIPKSQKLPVLFAGIVAVIIYLVIYFYDRKKKYVFKCPAQVDERCSLMGDKCTIKDKKSCYKQAQNDY